MLTCVVKFSGGIPPGKVIVCASATSARTPGHATIIVTVRRTRVIAERQVDIRVSPSRGMFIFTLRGAAGGLQRPRSREAARHVNGREHFHRTSAGLPLCPSQTR